MQLGNPLIQCALYWTKPDFLCVLTRLFQSQTKKKSTKIEDIGGKVTRRCNNCKSPRQWCCLPIWGKLVKFNALLVLRCRFRSDRTGTVKRGDRGEWGGKASLSDKASSPAGLDREQQGATRGIKPKAFCQRAALPARPFLQWSEKGNSLLPPCRQSAFLKQPLWYRLSIQFHQRPTPRGAGDTQLVPILLLCTWWFSLDQNKPQLRSPLGC